MFANPINADMIRDHAEKIDADAIAECRKDPELAAREAKGEYCIVCMMSRPCLCDKNRRLSEMRQYYEAHRRTLFRKEPTLTMSWGVKDDGLMDALFRIAHGQSS